MAPRISLALAIHNHQPVGNFGWVIEDVFQHAYRPLIEALLRHPGVRLSLHWSGPLLDWMPRAHPEAIEALRELVGRDQVEILGGGHYEPILPSIPERDRQGQLRRMADEVERLFGRRPQGAWLAERVWEPDLPRSLVDAGYAWTILDDNHFRAASIHEEAMWGAHVTEDQGRLLHVFGTEEGLRYRIPFRPAEEVIDHLRAHASEAGDRLGVMGDDGEKFGAWPGTFEHCWGSGRWMERFFGLLEANRDWLATVTPSAWLGRVPPLGRVYLPTASYLEMTEWALPADEAGTFVAIIERARAAGLPEQRWLRGAFWRNFQVRYREVNDLHKQMLRTSAKVARMPPGPERDLAVDHLYQGQSNDCYWHGLFGGVYLVHLRLATYAHLIAAEDLADRVSRRLASPARSDAGSETGTAAAEASARRSGPTLPAAGHRPRPTWAPEAAPASGAHLFDADLDGVDEAYLADEGQVVVVDLAEGAGIGSWDLRAARLAVGSVLRRRPEAYHARLREAAAEGEGAAAAEQRVAAQRDAAASPVAESSAMTAVPSSIHPSPAGATPGLQAGLVYDRFERRGGLLHFLPASTAPADLAAATHVELGDFVDGAFELEHLDPQACVVARTGSVHLHGRAMPVRVVKTLRISGARQDPRLQLDVAVENRSDERLSAEVALEWNSNMAGGGGNPAAYYRLPASPSRAGELDDEGRHPAHASGDERLPHDSSGSRARVEAFAFGNEDEGVDVTVSVSRPAGLCWFAVETTSNSESGFERVYQGSSWWVRWPVLLDPGASATFGVDLTARCRRDRAAEDGARSGTR